jgi:hypothetical protein
MLLVAALAGLHACGDGDRPNPSSPEREAAVLSEANAAFRAYSSGDIEAFYGYFTDDFRRRCALDDFEAFLSSDSAYVSAPSQVVTFVREDKALVQPALVDETTDIAEGSAGEDDFLYRWRFEGGRWKAHSLAERPCVPSPP